MERRAASGARTKGVGRTALATVCVAMILAGCAGPADRGTGRTAASPSDRPRPPSTTTSLAPLPPPPPVSWVPCDGRLQCGTVDVPLDYAVPGGPQLTIAMARRPALVPSRRIGSLVINPGGPGDSGIDDLAAELRILTPALQDDFDIVSFDPRGVERSDPVHCVQRPGTTPAPLDDPAPETASGQQALMAADRAYIALCRHNSGAVLGHVGTLDSARDLDRIRQALGDARLTYIGHSYGTFLGAIYADMFPDRVRAMVLDGALDPGIDLEQMSIDQAHGYEASFDSFAAWCGATASCPWHPGPDPTATFLGLASALRQHRLPAGGGRTAGVGELYFATTGTLTARSFWPALGSALARATFGDGSGLLALSDRYQVHGGYNSSDANAAINCLDHPVGLRPQDYPAAARAAGARSSVFGAAFVWSTLTCDMWPYPARPPAPTRAVGAPPIVVVGTSADPATPHSWAVALASELRAGVLVTRVGVDHVAYYYSPCVRALDEAYLVRGAVPVSGSVCSS